MQTTVLLLADIHPEIGGDEFQEWESLESVEHLKKTIELLGYHAIIFQPFYESEKILKFLYENRGNRERIIIWNLVEGFYSRNREAYVPGVSEFFGFPFTGADSYSQIISLDKVLTQSIAKTSGAEVPKSIEINSRVIPDSLPDFPLFCKPRFEGSSLGISSRSILQSKLELKNHLESLPLKLFPLLVEEYLPGREFTIGFIGLKHNLRKLSLCEICLDGVYSENVKRKNKMPEKVIPISHSEFPTIGEITLKIAASLGIYGYGRADWKLNEKGVPYFLEMNLTPGLSPFYSSFPISYNEEYQKMVEEILLISLEEYKSYSRNYGKGRI